jgi:hypothetical protein
MHRKLSFTIAEGPIYWRTHRIMELCDYLTSNVLEQMFAREGKKWDRRFMDFITFDNSCDPLEPTGTILFAVPPLFAGRVTELESAITQELAKLRIKTGPFEYERDPDREGDPNLNHGESDRSGSAARCEYEPHARMRGAQGSAGLPMGQRAL